MVSILTPTCDQPMGMALAESYMARQTYRGPIEWIVVDDGVTPVAVTQGQRYVRRARAPRESGAQSLCRNLLAGVSLVRGDIVLIWEHDDYYAPTHLETLVRQLSQPGIVAAGDDRQRYYNVARRVWQVFQNKGASLCQTAFHVKQISLFQRVVEQCVRENAYGVDGRFWTRVETGRSLERTETVLGIKGLPGRAGLGIGHRPSGGGWTADPEGQQLRAWIGADADVYLSRVVAA